jgi:hypothetical protein
MISSSALVGPVERFVISLLPDAYQVNIAGDLIEEASVVASASGTPAAKKWLRGQLVRSLPSVMSLHFRQKENDDMKHAKWIAAAALIVLGAVQAWDSGILNAPPMIGAMVAVAIAIGVSALFVEHDGLRFGIAVLVLVLLFAARMMSPVRLPELSLVGFPIFLVLVLGPKFLALRKERQGPRGPGAPA